MGSHLKWILFSLGLLCMSSTGRAQLTPEDNSIIPFEINIPEAELQDLSERLKRSRLPDQLDQIAWEYGTDLTFIEALLNRWQHDFDWRQQERRLNQLPQFMTNLQGLDIHFVHRRSTNPDAIPLLIVHGWPGSFVEFQDLVEPLAAPEAFGGDAQDSFHVVAPSLPGFAFSEGPNEPGYNPERIAHLLVSLMDRLGYDRFGIQGGDWGAIINRYIAFNYPDRIIGMHSNFPLAADPGGSPSEFATPLELQQRAAREAYMANERAYQQIQGTKPQSLGYALNDSPIGLAAWIAEKFHGWSDLRPEVGNDLSQRIDPDVMLTNISLYWFTGSITSSMRIYYENRNVPPQRPLGFIDVPTGIAKFPAEIVSTPRGWAEQSYRLVHWTEMPRGGHFAALEEPAALLEDIRRFFRIVR